MMTMNTNISILINVNTHIMNISMIISMNIRKENLHHRRGSLFLMKSGSNGSKGKEEKVWQQQNWFKNIEKRGKAALNKKVASNLKKAKVLHYRLNKLLTLASMKVKVMSKILTQIRLIHSKFP